MWGKRERERERSLMGVNRVKNICTSAYASLPPRTNPGICVRASIDPHSIKLPGS